MQKIRQHTIKHCQNTINKERLITTFQVLKIDTYTLGHN